MVKYESIIISDPGANDEETGTLIKGLEDAIVSTNGKVVRVERWGKRRLAYRIGKNDDGNYTLLGLDCPPATIKELERRCRMNDRVIKYMTVRVKDFPPEEKPQEAQTAPGNLPKTPSPAKSEQGKE